MPQLGSDKKAFDGPTPRASGQSQYQMMPLDTENGPIEVPVDTQIASRVTEEKRKAQCHRLLTLSSTPKREAARTFPGYREAGATDSRGDEGERYSSRSCIHSLGKGDIFDSWRSKGSAMTRFKILRVAMQRGKKYRTAYKFIYTIAMAPSVYGRGLAAHTSI